MVARPRVALNIQDPDSPYRYLLVRGPVVEITTEGAVEHFDKLSLKYTGNPKCRDLAPDEIRVIYKICPDHVKASG